MGKEKDPAELPAAERAARYHALAEDAERLARTAATDSIRDSYTLMARQWRKLADEAAEMAKRTRG